MQLTPHAVKGSACSNSVRNARLLSMTLFVYTALHCIDNRVRKRGRMRKTVLLTWQVAVSVLLVNLFVFSAYGQDGKQLYEQTCAMCHGVSGKGDGPTSQVLQPKPANLTVVLKDKKDAYLTKLIREGGASVGKSPLMPSYKGILNDKQMKSLIQYMKGFVAQ
jgi:cytochrome c553